MIVGSPPSRINCINKEGLLTAGPPAVCKKLFKRPGFLYNEGNGNVTMEGWRKDTRRDPVITDLDTLVPKDHLLRKIKTVLIQHLYGIPSFRQTYQRIKDTLSYRWF